MADQFRVSLRGTIVAGAAVAALMCSAATFAQQGSVEAGRGKAAVCAACHGADGNSMTPAWPSLAGQSEAYIAGQLRAYRDKLRGDVGMQAFAAALSEQDMLDLGAFYAAQPLVPKGADPEHLQLGEAIFRGGIPERGVAACMACHGPDGHGNPLAAYPRINSQHAQYLAQTLRDYAAGTRQSDDDKNLMMRNVAGQLLEEEIVALAGYIQGLQ